MFFGVDGRLLKAPFVRYDRNDYWVDRDAAEVVGTRGRGASSAEVLAAARPLDADYAPLPASVWADPHPSMAVEPIVSVLADLGEPRRLHAGPGVRPGASRG